MPLLTILADPEMALSLSQLSSSYARGHHNSVATSYGDPERQLTAIGDGEAADLYITSYPGITAELTKRGLTDIHTIAELGQEELVLVAARGWWKTQGNPRWPSIITRRDYLPTLIRKLPDARLILGDPNRIASGRIASDLLAKAHWQVPLTTSIAYSPSTAATLQRAEQPGTLALVYASDVARQPELIIISHFAPNLQPPVPVMAHVIAGERMEGARDLLEYLREDWGTH